MNQMQKRLEIIKIAISMTDEETIKLQLLKLDHFEEDKALEEIILLLKDNYYAQAQEKITEYNMKSSDNEDSQKQSEDKYEKIPDISTIFHKLALIYYKDNSNDLTKSAGAWIKHISNSGYSDSETYKILAHVNILKEESNLSEAAQLMLVCGATKSNLGRLLFARELIKGDLFEKNENDALKIIKELALAKYDEAICDYGQLIEHGIGIIPDKEYAKKLYKEAAELGSNRGKRLYEKLNKKRNKFLSFLGI